MRLYRHFSVRYESCAAASRPTQRLWLYWVFILTVTEDILLQPVLACCSALEVLRLCAIWIYIFLTYINRCVTDSQLYVLPAGREADKNMSLSHKHTKMDCQSVSLKFLAAAAVMRWILSVPSCSGAVRSWCCWSVVGTSIHVPGKCWHWLSSHVGSQMEWTSICIMNEERG